MQGSSGFAVLEEIPIDIQLDIVLSIGWEQRAAQVSSTDWKMKLAEMSIGWEQRAAQVVSEACQ